MRRTINFDENYNNKLNCVYFTTIRRGTPEHIEEYTRGLGKHWNILLQGKKFCIATLIDVHLYSSILMVDTQLLVLDTGRRRVDAVALLYDYGIGKSNEGVLILTFEVNGRFEISEKDKELGGDEGEKTS